MLDLIMSSSICLVGRRMDMVECGVKSRTQLEVKRI